MPKVNLILTLVCREYYNDRVHADPTFVFSPVQWGEVNPQCYTRDVQQYFARFNQLSSLISGVLCAIMAPKLGALSDRYGRKRIMMITSSGMLVSEIVTIVAANFPDTFPVKFLLLGFVFDGLCGSFIASMALSSAYATDCTPPEKRNVAFGYFHAALFTGIAMGPLLGGYVTKWTGTLLTMFYIALGCHLTFLLFLLFAIPESLSKTRQLAAREKYRIHLEELGTAAGWTHQIGLYNFLAPLKVLYPTGPGSSPALRRNLLLLSSIDTVVFGVAMGSMSIIVAYIGKVFQWGQLQQGVFTSIVSASRAVCLLFVLPLVTRLFRGRRSTKGSHGADNFELNVIRTAIFFDILGFLGYVLSRQGAFFIVSGVVAAFGGMGSPTLQAALTKHVRPDEIGSLLGAIGLLHALARIVSPIALNGVWSLTVARFDQAVYVVLTSLFGIAFSLALFIKPGGENCSVCALACNCRADHLCQ